MHIVTASRADIKLHFAENKPLAFLKADEMTELDLSLTPIVELLSKVYFHTTNTLECKAE